MKKHFRDIKRLSEIKAAKRVGLNRGDQFFKQFVLIGKLIEPIQYPGEKRRYYIEDEVNVLPEYCRLTPVE